MARMRWRWPVLFIAGLYFCVPLLSSFIFTVRVPGDGPDSGWNADAYKTIFSTDGFWESLLLSLGLAVVTVTLAIALLLPAMIATRLSAPKLRPILEVLCTLPLVVPPITLVAGLYTILIWNEDYFSAAPTYQSIIAIQNEDFPLVLVFAYLILVLPFTYRSIDAGLRAIDLRTLVEAARNLGAGWPQVVATVIIPNLRSALASASFLGLALVLGEFSIANSLNYQSFAVWITRISGTNPQLSVAVSLFSMALTWVLLLVLSTAGTRRKETVQ